MEVLPDVNPVYEAALLALGSLLEGFGRCGQKDGCVVPEDSGEDLEG